MARDYKNAAPRAKKRPIHGSWMSFISGLGVGLLVAFGVYLWSGHLRVPGQPVTTATPVSPPPVPAEHGRSAAELPRPQFDFYKILPEMEVPIPDWELDEDEPETAAVPAAELDQGTYVLQVGSFKNFDDADRVKATLAMRGITASIQRVVINGQDVWFRVHVGPLSDEGEIRAMRMELIENDLDFILLRIGDTGGAAVVVE